MLSVIDERSTFHVEIVSIAVNVLTLDKPQNCLFAHCFLLTQNLSTKPAPIKRSLHTTFDDDDAAKTIHLKYKFH